MPTHHVYARTEYADPLAHVGDVDVDTVDLAAATSVADDDTDVDAWLEVASIPVDKIVWVIRDGSLVEDRATTPQETSS